MLRYLYLIEAESGSEKSTFCDYYDLVHYDTDIYINECNSR